MMSTIVCEDEGLRARKNRATRTAIHEAAVARVLEDGLESATVAAIATEANVSTRTFFNYFRSKEDALFGQSEEIDEDELSRFTLQGVPDDRLLASVAALVRHVLLSSLSDSGSTERRAEVLRRHPELARVQAPRLLALENRISAVVATHLRARGTFECADIDIDQAAQMLVMLCASPVRYAMRAEAQHGREASDAVFTHSVELLHQVIRKVS